MSLRRCQAQQRARQRSRRRTGDFAFEGPQTLTLDEIVRTLNRDPAKRIRHLPEWVSLGAGPLLGMRRDFVRFSMEDALETAPNIFVALNLSARPLSAAWPAG